MQICIILNERDKGRSNVNFSDYLKTCREQSRLTQEQLVEELYLFDDSVFRGLDTTTVSKWERMVTQPKVPKQVRILQYFQGRQKGKAFPCLDNCSIEENESALCKRGIENLIIGKRKELVLNFPSEMMTADNLTLTHLRNKEQQRQKTLLEVANDMRNSYHPAFTHMHDMPIRSWALYPGNLFLISQYKDVVTGFLFVLRLKKEIQKKILHFEMQPNALTLEDFASFDEPGNHLILNFFALNPKSAVLLSIRYYAHLIANQDNIESIGAAVAKEDAKRILENMNLSLIDRYTKEDTEVTSYREILPNVIASENVVRMLFRKEACPEE